MRCNRRSHFVTATLGLAVLLFLAPSSRAGILPPDGSYAGRTYNDWQVLWWQTFYGTPIVNGDHPGISGGVLGEQDGVVMLTGIGGGASLDLTILKSSALFFPIFNIESSVFEPPPFHGDDEASLRANSEGLLDQATGLFAEIDGLAVDLTSYRFVSPLFTWGPLPSDNLLGAPAGTTSDAVDAGYYLLLTPFGSRGTHTIHFGGTIESMGFSIDTTYTLDVVPEPASLTILATGGLGLLAYRWRRRVRAKS
jgi:hypothetical protein